MTFTKTLSIALLATVLAFTGCKKKDDATVAPADKTATPATPNASAPAAKPTEATPAAATGAVTIASDADYQAKGTAMLGTLINMFKTDGSDCDKIAADATALFNDPNTTALMAYEKAHPDAKHALDASLKDRTKEFEAAAGPAMTSCKDNQKMKDAFSKFN